jgi:cytochrome P450
VRRWAIIGRCGSLRSGDRKSNLMCVSVARTPDRPPAQVDLSSQDFWHRPAAEREQEFAKLRRESPLSWHRAPDTILEPPEGYLEGGYWAIVRYADVRAISRDPQTFCSGQGVMFEGTHPDLLEASQSFLAMDAPRHTKLRGLVSAAFIPRQVARVEQQIRERAHQIVDELAPLGECDFVSQVAKRLPMMTICDMIGVPEADRERLVSAADDLVGWNDPVWVGDRDPLQMIFDGILTLTHGALEMADHRAQHPGDDLMTALVQAEVDGQRLAPEEIGAFFVLLSVAGNDTTRHTTSHAMLALSQFPDQRRLLVDDLAGHIETAVEEFVRWGTPVMTFGRTATRPTELHGQPIAEGEKVVLFYTSANRDEDAFEHPERFDVLRQPNHHVGFGGGGPHYCLGASLARSQLRAIVSELLTRVPDIEAHDPEPLVGNFINGIRRMPCSFTPA